MKFTPRDYQQAAHDAVIAHWKKTTVPCLVEAATGAGKAIIISMLAETLHSLSGKRVLCLAHSSELVTQNASKFEACGVPYSIYSASIAKNLSGLVIFATDASFKRVAKKMAGQFAGVILDECHRIVPTVKTIIEELKEGNPNLRVCGLSATPYRLGTGFVVKQGPDGVDFPESQCVDPYFGRMVYSIAAPALIKRGYLTPPLLPGHEAESYDTSGLTTGANGQFSAAAVEKAFEGWGRKTASIVGDVLAQAAGRVGIIWFAATVRHAQEIMASLPPDESRMIGGDINTKAEDRKNLVADYKAQKYRHLVSVGTMTTGVDFTHVDCIAILRATESVSLLQQIIGRGLRLHDGKRDCLVLDYGGNIARHCQDGDIFRPEIEAAYQKAGEGTIEAKCEWCGFTNLFTPRPNDLEMGIDANGYFIDETGERVTQDVYAGKDDGEEAETKAVPIPAHYGRRCTGSVITRDAIERCGYFWTCKQCPDCGHENDIAARYCQKCKAELVNPNEKLQLKKEQIEADYRKHKRDLSQPQTEAVLTMSVHPCVSQSSKPMQRVMFTTTERAFSVFFLPEETSYVARTAWARFQEHTENATAAPKTITYIKEESGFFRVTAFNQPTDASKLLQKIAELEKK